MGGPRCTFRGCTSTTIKFPGMHFFHYPHKDKERLEKWISNANYSFIHQLTSSQAKNKVVCALHFRDECFMNYKKDRLVPTAIPTLVRLKNCLVLDFSTSDNPTPTILPPTTAKHLIPPKGYQPLGLPSNFFSSPDGVEVLEWDGSEEPPAKRPAPTILNQGLRSVPRSSSCDQIEFDEVTTLSLSDDAYEEDEYGFVIPVGEKSGGSTHSHESINSSEVVSTTQIINLDEIEFLEPDPKDCAETGEDLMHTTLLDSALKTKTKNSNEHELERKEIEALESRAREQIYEELKQEFETKQNEAEETISRLENELKEARNKAQHFEARSVAAELVAQENQKKLEEALEQLARASATPKDKPSGVVPGQLTKTQLFNGIKKYVSASMTAIVRMEMFASNERQWKPDEKQACVELLKLGEHVYKYFSDEWRLRLPSRKLVEQWTNEVTEEDEDDL